MTERTRITVGPDPGLFLARGLYLDGDRPMPIPVSLRVDDDAGALTVTEQGRAPVQWPFSEIRALRDQAGGDQMVLRLAGDPTPRLILPDAGDHVIIRSRCRRIDEVPRDRKLWPIFAWGAAAIGSVALIIGVLIPVMADQLAEFLPPEGEKALGEATFEQIRGALDETGFQPLPICEDAAGQAALAKMEARLVAQADLPTDLTVYVLDHPMVNAFALPGGIVVFFDGLIAEADTPEQVAAVFAHEMGHVAARDPTRIALRSAGSIGVLGLLLGDFAGGTVVLFLTERLIQADYTREAEAAADAYAHELLLRADLSPAAIGRFFAVLQSRYGDETGVVQHFMSHPALGDRIEAARAATPDNFEPAPLLSDAEWSALKGICDGAYRFEF